MNIAVVDPISSGECLVSALEDLGCRVWKIYSSPSTYTAESICSILHEDYESTLKFLVEKKVDRILAGSEYGIELCDELSHRLGLLANEYSKLSSRLDKAKMYQTLKLDGIPVANFEVLKSHHDCMVALERFVKYPLFVKPNNSAGSDGCFKCDTEQDALIAFDKIYSRKNFLGRVNAEVLLQEYIEGSQYIVNTVSYSGRHVVTEVYKVRLDEIDGIPIYRSIVTEDIGTAHSDRLIAYVKCCLDSLGVKNGAAHTEVRSTTDGIRLIEVNSRLMGPLLDSDAFHFGFGYSQATLLAESCVLPNVFMKRFENNHAMKRHFSMVFLRNGSAGKVLDRRGLSELRRLPAFHSVHKLPSIGLLVDNPLLTTGSFGIAYLAHEDKVLLEHSLNVLHSLEDSSGLYGVSGG